MSTAMIVQQASKLASMFDIPDTGELVSVLKATAFKGPVTDAQMSALLIVANQYGLNPWTKEIYAFPDKNNGIVPVVGVDGWARIINGNPAFDGMEFREDAESCTCIIHRKDRGHPVAVTEYMSECKRNAGPWQTHPRRMLRHKATIQCARLAFGFAGIYDQDEAERITERDMGRAVVAEAVVDPEYMAFEAAHLPTLQAAAKGGLPLLEQTFAEIPKGVYRTAMWKTHGADLKAEAAAADAIAVEVEQP